MPMGGSDYGRGWMCESLFDAGDSYKMTNDKLFQLSNDDACG